MQPFLLLLLFICGTYGQSTEPTEPTEDPLWTEDPTIIYGTSTQATTPAPACELLNGDAGACVESRKYCKTKHSNVVRFRASRPCEQGVCCKLSDVIPNGGSTTTEQPTPPPPPVPPTPSIPTTPTTQATPSMPECDLFNGDAGVCVESLEYCKTEHSRVPRWRASRPCQQGVCCKLSDVIPNGVSTNPRIRVTPSTSTTPPPISIPLPPPGPVSPPPAPSNPTPPATSTLPDQTTPPVLPNPTPEPVGCGVRNENGVFFKGGVVNNDAGFGEFPWTVAIFKIENGKDEYKCVGSLIHPRVVLTVASKFRRGGEFKVRVGDWHLRDTNEMYGHEERAVTSMVTHEKFNSGSGANDVGLLFLNKEVLQDAHINYACLPDASVVTQPSTTCLMSGWGSLNSDGPTLDTQKYLELPIVDRDTCQTKIREALRNKRYNLSASMLCAGGNGPDACKGDGGAPLVCPYPGQTKRYYQAGIVSWGVKCGTLGLPGVYSDVVNLRGWIDQKVVAAGYTTNYYTPTLY